MASLLGFSACTIFHLIGCAATAAECSIVFCRVLKIFFKERNFMAKLLENAIAVLNGVVGDYLVRSQNGLATEMAFYHQGRPISLDAISFQRAFPTPPSRIIILVHGLMNTETAWAFSNGDDYGQLLAKDFGDAPFYLRYNSGRSIADNGAELSRLLTTLISVYPIPISEMILLGYSMGGLLVRSACHAASFAKDPWPWLPKVARAIYVGTPHLGAPMERVGRVVTKVLGAIPNPYTQLISEIANLRSEGIKDLGDADLRHEDRALKQATLLLQNPEHPVPLLKQIKHYLLAGTLSEDPTLALLFGDFMVPLGSATDGACIDAETMALPPSHIKILPGIAHIDLPRRPEVYEHIRAWCTPEET
jgi:triacylglycerol lipase